MFELLLSVVAGVEAGYEGVAQSQGTGNWL